MKPLSAALVAELLQNIYSARFSGKTRGRYTITREQMRELSGRTGRLELKIQSRIVEEARKLGLVVIPMETGFSVIESSKVGAWRPVSNQVIRSLAYDDEDDSHEDIGENSDN